MFSEAHHLTVKQLAFRPQIGEIGEDGESQTLLLASAGCDYTVKIHAVSLQRL